MDLSPIPLFFLFLFKNICNIQFADRMTRNTLPGVSGRRWPFGQLISPSGSCQGEDRRLRASAGEEAGARSSPSGGAGGGQLQEKDGHHADRVWRSHLSATPL